MIIFETYEARKKQTLSKDDIRDILAWDGSEKDALKHFNISKDTYKYIHRAYDKETASLNYRDDPNVYYE